MTKHVMIDIETMDNTPTSAILSIGAVEFNPRERTALDVNFANEFDINVSLEDCAREGLTIGARTVLWWMQQSNEARKSVSHEGVSLHEALANLTHWFRQLTPLGDVLDLRVWAHSPSFDLVILENAYRAINWTPPWEFRSHRCTRTIYDLAGIDMKTFPRGQRSVAHNALDDARHQARAVQYAGNIIN